MKVKQFDRFQVYLLDQIYEKYNEDKDLPEILNLMAVMQTPETATTIAYDLSQTFLAFPSEDPANDMWRSWGFVAPLHDQPVDSFAGEDGREFDAQAPVITISGTTDLLFCVEKREKIIPGQCLQDKTIERVKALEEREQRPANKKDWAIMKEEVTSLLLKTALVRRSRTNVIISGRWCIVFTSSAKVAEDVTSLIRKAIGSFPVVPALGNEFELRNLFRDIVLQDPELLIEKPAEGIYYHPQGKYRPSTEAKFMNEDRAVVTIKDEEVSDSRGKELISDGFYITELMFRVLNVKMDDSWVKMNHKGDIKSFSLASVTDSESDYEMFDKDNKYGDMEAKLWLLMNNIKEFLNGLVVHGLIDRPVNVDALMASIDAFKQATSWMPGYSTEDEEDDDDWTL